jgi:hypothetical protein
MMFALGRLAVAQAQPAETLPMYGQPGIVRSDDLKKADALPARRRPSMVVPGAASVYGRARAGLNRDGKPDLRSAI